MTSENAAVRRVTDIRVTYNVGRVKYALSWHEEGKAHKDGSPFYDGACFQSKKKMDAFITALTAPVGGWDYSRWRHGGWYVHNVRYPSGACGCVSCNYDDHKWRIACDPRPFEQQPTFSCRDDAAAAEYWLVQQMKKQAVA
jgi:hypothetical protein